MPDNICFGCGKNTKNGLHIKSYWNGKEAECIWFPKPYNQGWSSIMNGGIQNKTEFLTVHSLI